MAFALEVLQTDFFCDAIEEIGGVAYTLSSVFETDFSLYSRFAASITRH
jgi:hypothetical protein